MKRCLFLAAGILLVFFSSCNINPDSLSFMESNVNNRYSGLKDITDDMAKLQLPGRYTVLVLNDVHFGSEFDVQSSVAGLFAWLDTNKAANTLPAFCLVLGDVSNGGKETEYQEYQQFVERIESYGIKVLSVVGNHDVLTGGWKYWKQYCYPNTSFYRFETAGFVWYGLDSGSGTLGSKQMNAFLAAWKGETKTPIVFSHFPLEADQSRLFAMRDTTERNLLIGAFLEKHIAVYLSGHYHPQYKQQIGTFTEYCFASFGQYGQWSILTVDESDPGKPAVTVELH